MKLTKSAIVSFRKKIFSWWKSHQRDLPWRATHDPYAILVSEVMLQQTQVNRVQTVYREFLQEFPDVHALAQARASAVLRRWKGMGYNRRALYLQKAAQMIVHTYLGKFPESEQLLTKLPGVGTYTARAILVFAYEQKIAAVDTNIRQIIVHHFFQGANQKESVIQSVADQLVPPRKSWAWHQALMDYGALEMRNLKPKKQNAKASHIPFRQTNRFYRGRIMDMLRVRSCDKDRLIDDLIDLYGKDLQYYESQLYNLEKEGLIVHNKHIYSLPD